MNMKAIIYTEYGSPDVLHVGEVAKPTPKDNEVLIKIHAAPVNFGDRIARNFRQVTPRSFSMPAAFWLMTKLVLGVTRPKRQVLGSEFAGKVEAVGKSVTRFKVGDDVFGYPSMNFGAYAEYLCMPENGLLALKPGGMTDEQAAAVPYGALTALTLLRKVNVQKGQKVLINGASGAIGSYAVQLARYFGAEVTGVCGTPRVELVKSLGAQHVIDYTRVDFTTRGETYDVIFDVLGKSSFSRVKRALTPTGTYLRVSFKVKHLLQMLWTSRRPGKRVLCAMSNERPEDLRLIKDLIEAGDLRSVVDRCYPMEQAADAHRYAESGEQRGHVVIRMGAFAGALR